VGNGQSQEAFCPRCSQESAERIVVFGECGAREADDDMAGPSLSLRGDHQLGISATIAT
jgi:hypothetical protein